MEASALQHTAPASALIGHSPLLRLQGDEKLIALIRRGHHAAFEALMQRYQPRLLAFCRHMLSSTEDAEDVLQEVFAAAFNAICADDRPINARPWLYRIARNRCLNHLRRPVPAGQDTMDVFERDGGTTTADTVHKREEFRQIVSDVQDLPETQRTALLLREIDALSYDQIAEAMDTTVPSVKSLLVRARVSLAEAAEARLLTCEEVRLELGEVAEGLKRTTAPVRRHLKGCDRCRTFRKELRGTSRALAAVYPLGPMILLKKLVLAKLGAAAGQTAGAGAGAGGMGLAGGAAVAGGAGSALSAGVGAVASKTAAGLAAAAIVTAGAVEVRQAGGAQRAPAAPRVTAAVADPVRPAPAPPSPAPAPATQEVAAKPKPKKEPAADRKKTDAEEKELAAAAGPEGEKKEQPPAGTAPAATQPAGSQEGCGQQPTGAKEPAGAKEPTGTQPDPVAPAKPEPTKPSCSGDEPAPSGQPDPIAPVPGGQTGAGGKAGSGSTGGSGSGSKTSDGGSTSSSGGSSSGSTAGSSSGSTSSSGSDSGSTASSSSTTSSSGSGQQTSGE